MSDLDEAKAVLAAMMKEIAENEIPTDETWNRACKLLGRPPIARIKTGKTIRLLPALIAAPTKFKQ